MLVCVSSSSVRVWLDPFCPWAWLVANWLEEVSLHRKIDVDQRTMSLALLPGNSARRNEPFMEASLEATLVLTAVAQELGSGASKRLYMSLGKKIHKEEFNLGNTATLIADSLSDTGLPEDFSRRSSEYYNQLQESTSTALSLVGDQCGTPVVSVGDVAFFGPVISRVPRGEDAVRFFDSIVSVCSWSGFYELKRTRSEGPQIG